ncbi:MAG TPA: sigma 54-interacting transcriptional regulator [Polyangium sp.]|nr:sigma 54-interacting transcriptional regulator [Polyangium sp.]
MRTSLRPERLSSPRMSLELVVFLGNESQTITLPEHGEVTIGRATESDVRIDDASISRRHAKLRVDDEITVEDLGSANGTSVRRLETSAGAETERIQRGDCFIVGIGDVITFGSVRACIRRGRVKSPEDALEQTSADEPVIVDPVMKALVVEARRAARGDLPVLLLGETGVGKEVLARYIHRTSRQTSGKFVVLHIAAMSESLLEAELFGHEKGAFTGATEARVGLIEAADGGTVLLDELGEIPLGLQVKLLRVLEERSVTRIGARKSRPVDVRFIAATHRDLEARIAEGQFRADLYYRINGISLRIPPLRERRADISAIAEALLEAACRRLDRALVPRLSAEVLRVFDRYEWPGNVRELRNVMDRAAVFCEEQVLQLQHLPKAMVDSGASPVKPISSVRPEVTNPVEVPAPVAADEFRSVVEDLDRRRVLDALAACGGNQTRAAEMLGMSRRTLVARLDAYGLPRPRKGT